MPHKTEDYKLSAVKFYLKNEQSMDKVCGIFDCKKSTLKDWVHKYKNNIILHEIIERLFPIKSKRNKSKLLSIFSKQMNKLP